MLRRESGKVRNCHTCRRSRKKEGKRDEETIAVILTCALLFSALSTGAFARSGRLDETLAVETRALAVEIESEGAVYETPITLRDVAENETKWGAFLDQLTPVEMIDLVIHSGCETQGVERLGIPATEDNDGPFSVNGPHGLVYEDSGTAYPCETAVACTWNADLAERMGEAAGREAADMGEDIWNAPGLNLHRNHMGGRNFEYFSEDPLLTGKMGAAVVTGANRHELVTTVKHFANVVIYLFRYIL